MSQATNFRLLLRVIDAVKEKREPDFSELADEAALAAHVELLAFLKKHFPELKPRFIPK
jgi:hypothetical protein